MVRSIKASIMLADYAQVTDGKLNLLGGGWTVTGPDPTPFALVALIEFPWEAAGENHTAKLELIDDEGVPVMAPGPESEVPIVLKVEFPVAAGVGIRRGTPLTVPVAVNLPPTPIPPGGRYEWRLEVDGQTHEEWRASFSTRQLPPPQQLAA